MYLCFRYILVCVCEIVSCRCETWTQIIIKGALHQFCMSKSLVLVAGNETETMSSVALGEHC